MAASKQESRNASHSIIEMGVGIQGRRSGDQGRRRTRSWKPMARRQGLCSCAQSQSDELFVREKEWRRLRARTAGISTWCLGLVDKISSGSHRPRRAPCYPLIIADRVMSQSLGRGKLETKGQPTLKSLRGLTGSSCGTGDQIRVMR